MRVISVCIPVGPNESDKRWLMPALESIKKQTLQPKITVIIDDGAGISSWCTPGTWQYLWHNGVYCKTFRAPWRLGISHAFNFGVMLAPTECVFMLGSDDILEPNCLEECWRAYNEHKQADGYYSVPVRYIDTGEVQTAPCNAAMVTKGFWRKTGGFPIESSIGIGDSMLLSICLAHKLPVYWVMGVEPTPLYNYRRHPDIHTYKLGSWWHILDQIRDKVTADWKEPEWVSKYE